MNLRTIRLTAAIVCFTLITLLFLDFTGTLHVWFGWLAKIQFLPALLALNVGVVLFLVVLTLVLGRIYCSVVCPLGVFQDIVSWMRGKTKRNRFKFSPALNWLRYAMLGILILFFMAGVSSIVVLLEPYSAYGRIAANLFAPVYQWGNNLLALLAERADSYAFYPTEVWMKNTLTLIIACLSFVVLFILAWRSGRTYCNTLCPVGTILGFFSRISLLKPVINTEKCNGCGLCARNCKASCIHPKEHKIDYSRCVVCMDCVEKCKQGAIKYMRRTPETKADAPHKSVNETKRNFLSVTALFATTALLKAQEKKVDGGLAAIIDKKIPKRSTPLTPPGGKSLRHFTSHCTACQLCISACPNQVLRPSSELTTLMQPEMSYERGYCRPECAKCSEVCPTGAICSMTTADKSATQIGHAVWIKKNCVVLNDKVSCGNCARHCPTGAIQMVAQDNGSADSLKIPVVDVERCIGCGACENLCPARPFSAIYVEGHQMHRTI